MPHSSRRWIPALLLPLAVAAAAQGNDYAKVQIKTTKLSDHVYMLVGAGGNIGVSVGDGAVIIAHDNVRRRLNADQVMAFIGAKQPASAHPGLPVLTVPDDITLHLNGDEIHAFHVPKAHTDGDMVVHFRKADVIHMGDTFFNGFYPFIDFDNGGSTEGMIASADRVLALATDRTQIIPGHGPLATRADLVAFRDMLQSVSARIRTLRAEGRSDEQIAAAKPSAAFDAAWGGGFIQSEKFVAMMLGATGR